ncbi:putative glycolipid-binding domain-containing protein [Paracoccus marinaquae]|uniref:Glycolipid-binding domain-containing protein n=1 Tax=Paracoccus marinaquae TaxID=2841926 RepID=A0ABS6AJL8_9RHOB|nr:putative glycolipid-binding domain-containing protein [Paracoccus marinaquae]MBU3030312.1 putative glycolipid-binding domain-containing protein [Paracoccus marinaquae]
MAAGALILWRRLDRPGHDACALRFEAGEWHLEGAAAWRDRNGPAQVTYSIICGEDWQTRSARLSGRVAGQGLSLSIRRGAGGEWRANGAEVPGSHGLIDLDLAFTPATNTLALNRLKVPGGGDSAAIWLDEGDWRLKPLHQGYRRQADGRWHYRAAEPGFETFLTVNRHGFVTDYPEFWTQED